MDGILIPIAGVVAALRNGAARYAQQVGRPLELRRVLVRDAAKPRDGIDAALLTTSIDEVLADPSVEIVIELMGGEHPAREYIQAALASGRHVVTANKEVMAKFGGSLLQIAHDHGVRLLYEASVGGGIPIIAPLSRDLLANEVSAVTAIINGTTNYMLTAMAQQGADYEDVLAEAQDLGYAEPDPTADVEGLDVPDLPLALGHKGPAHRRQGVRPGECLGFGKPIGQDAHRPQP